VVAPPPPFSCLLSLSAILARLERMASVSTGVDAGWIPRFAGCLEAWRCLASLAGSASRAVRRPRTTVGKGRASVVLAGGGGRVGAFELAAPLSSVLLRDEDGDVDIARASRGVKGEGDGEVKEEEAVVVSEEKECRPGRVEELCEVLGPDEEPKELEASDCCSSMNPVEAMGWS